MSRPAAGVLITSSGWCLFSGGRHDYHWTFVKQSDRFMIHSTWAAEVVHRDIWLAIDLARVAQLFNDSAWIADVAGRVWALHHLVDGPDWLKNIGATSLLPMRLDPLEGRQLPNGTIDAYDLKPIPVERPWEEGSPFEWWAVHDSKKLATASHPSVVAFAIRPRGAIDTRAANVLDLGLAVRLLVGEDKRGDPVDAFGVGDRIDLDDLAPSNGEAHHSHGLFTQSDDHSGGSVHQRGVQVHDRAHEH